MMKIFIPYNEGFNYDECKKLYELNQPLINDDACFDDVIKNTLFYSFYKNDILALCLYFFVIDDKLWVNAFGKRKHHLFNKQCIELAKTWFNCDVWAESNKKPAIFLLKSVGFKKYKDNLYVLNLNCDTK